jgi:hypothetical protein
MIALGIVIPVIVYAMSKSFQAYIEAIGLRPLRPSRAISGPLSKNNEADLLRCGVLRIQTAEVVTSHGARHRVQEYWLNGWPNPPASAIITSKCMKIYPEPKGCGCGLPRSSVETA